MSTVLEETAGCAKQFMCDLTIHLMTVLSSLYKTIMDRAIIAPDYGNNSVDGNNATENVI